VIFLTNMFLVSSITTTSILCNDFETMYNNMSCYTNVLPKPTLSLIDVLIDLMANVSVHCPLNHSQIFSDDSNL